MYTSAMTSQRDFIYFARALNALHWGLAVVFWFIIGVLWFAPKSMGLDMWGGTILALMLLHPLFDRDGWGERLQRSVFKTTALMLCIDVVAGALAIVACFNPALITSLWRWASCVVFVIIIVSIVADRR